MNIDPLRSELDEAAHLTHYPVEGVARPWALFGSTVMMLWGLRDRIGDVDVFVAPTIWEYLAGRLAWQLHLPCAADPPFLERRVGGLSVHAFYAWTALDPEVNAHHCRAAAELVHGWWCTPLPLILAHKAMARKHGDSPRHAKHQADAVAISVFLGLTA